MRARVAVVLLAALAVTPSSPAAPPSASRPAAAPAGRNLLTIATVPSVAGVRFEAGGQTFSTGPDGVARISLPAGRLPLRLLDTKFRRPEIRSTFFRWGDDVFSPTRTVDLHQSTRLEVGFEQTVLVHFSFLDRSRRSVDDARVTRLTLKSTIGSRESFQPTHPRWLISTRVTRRFDGLQPTQIQYSVERAIFDGSDVVHRAQQRFYPASTRHVAVQLLLYSARLGAHDLLFGFRVGKKLDLIYPDGHQRSFPVDGRSLWLHSLPRGTYAIKIHTWGYSPTVPLALSRDQVIDLRVVSYLDLLVMLFALVVVTACLVLVRRPHLRARLVPNRLRRPRAVAAGSAVPSFTPRPAGDRFRVEPDE
jgi:hypothetical protein